MLAFGGGLCSLSKKQIYFMVIIIIIITSARRYCDPSCLLVNWLVLSFVAVFVR